MVDTLTPDQRRLNMRRIRARDTAPEMTVRRLLHARGFRFRLHRRDLPGRPDVVLPRYRVVVFVNGCFWHGHHCPLFKVPATRTDFWMAKIEANRGRDIAAMERLRDLGWRSGSVWECAVRGPGRLAPPEVAERMSAFILGKSPRAEIEGDFAVDNRRARSLAP